MNSYAATPSGGEHHVLPQAIAYQKLMTQSQALVAFQQLNDIPLPCYFSDISHSRHGRLWTSQCIYQPLCCRPLVSFPE
jgi:hypothetical protein